MEATNSHTDQERETTIGAALAQCRSGNYGRAITILKQYLQRCWEDVEVWFYFAECHRFMRKRKMAVRCYEFLLGLDPMHKWANAELGVILVDMGRPKEALQYLERALVLWPENVRLLIARGTALGLLSDLEKANSDFSEVLSRCPWNKEATMNIVGVNVIRGCFAEALEWAQKGVQYHPGDEEIEEILLLAQCGVEGKITLEKDKRRRQ